MTSATAAHWPSRGQCGRAAGQSPDRPPRPRGPDAGLAPAGPCLVRQRRGRAACPSAPCSSPTGRRPCGRRTACRARRARPSIADLHADKAQMIVRKGFHTGIDSYSAFRENDRMTRTGLDGYLKARGFTRLVICGLALDYCVAWSAIDARQAGFERRRGAGSDRRHRPRRQQEAHADRDAPGRHQPPRDDVELRPASLKRARSPARCPGRRRCTWCRAHACRR